MGFEAIDVFFLIIVIFTSIRAGIRGFVRELMSMAALIVGIAVAVVFSGVVAVQLEVYLGDSIWNQIIAFLGLFLLTYLLLKVFEGALRALVERIHADNLDHALGFFLGIAEGLIIVFVLLLLIQIQPFFDLEAAVDASVFALILKPLLPYVDELLHFGGQDV
jgi:membrane protein required for colicin V production